MKPVYLIDTIIIVDHFCGAKKATEWLLGLHEGEAAISVVTRSEVLSGVTENEKEDVLFFLDTYECLQVSTEIADLAAILSKQNRWSMDIAYQAAIAIKHHLIFVTRNTQDFRQEDHSFVLIPYRL